MLQHSCPFPGLRGAPPHLKCLAISQVTVPLITFTHYSHSSQSGSEPPSLLLPHGSEGGLGGQATWVGSAPPPPPRVTWEECSHLQGLLSSHTQVLQDRGYLRGATPGQSPICPLSPNTITPPPLLPAALILHPHCPASIRQPYPHQVEFLQFLLLFSH